MARPDVIDASAEPLSATHEVFNQVPPLEGYDAYLGDAALREAVHREGAAWADADLSRYGVETTKPEVVALGFEANRNRPVLRTHDRTGRRIDVVDYHPAYHELMRRACEEGLHASPWADPKPGAHVARAAKYYLHTQVEAAHCCPVTMTFASVPSLRLSPALAESWLPKVTARAYDGRNVPAADKKAVTIGMGMTEKQGGSDVRANTTTASRHGDVWELVGHKWFLSAPMCDAFLVLAQAPSGLSCFFLPRWLPDGSKNAIEIQRLKDKMGNVANASSEVEFRGAVGWLLGEEGRGVPAIIEMVAMTRFDCMIGSSGGQRQAVAQAVHHAAHRDVFGKRLIDQPLMKNVLADLALETEGAVALTMRIGRALDSMEDPHERALVRLGTPVGKYWICKRTPGHAYEAMECLGGNGVTEDFILARLYREAPINPIWEGSGNVQALDLLRAVGRSPEVLAAWFAEISRAAGRNATLDAAVDRLHADLADRDAVEVRARRLADQLALVMQAAILVDAGNEAVSEAFVASRLGGQGERQYGTLPPNVDFATILDRANPHVPG